MRQEELSAASSQGLLLPGQLQPRAEPSSGQAVSLNEVQGLVQHKNHMVLSIFRAVLLGSGAS